MGNSSTREKIEGLHRQVIKHMQKIDRERQKSQPNERLIRHWEKEISAFSERINRLEQCLVRRRKRGR